MLLLIIVMIGSNRNAIGLTLFLFYYVIRSILSIFVVIIRTKYFFTKYTSIS